MCTGNDGVPGSVAEALRMASASMDYLNGPGAGELDAWVSVLTGPFGSQSEVASAIAHSLEAEKLLVNQLYVHFLGREAGASEQATWANQLQLGATEEQVIAGLVSSPEFATHLHTLVRPSGSADQDYVEALYSTLLNRMPSSSEVAGWVAELTAGASRKAIALAFATSTEYRDDQVAVFYGNLLHRAGSAAETAAWAATSFDLWTIETLFAGSDMKERREILGRLSGLFVLVEGGPGVEHEADVAAARGAALIPVGRSGGYAAALYGRISHHPAIDASTSMS